EAAYFDGTFFSWGYGGSYNYFARPVKLGGGGTGAPSFRLELENNSANLRGRARAYSWNTWSDSRVKKNQRDIEYGLEDLLLLKPKSYDHYSSEFINGELTLEDHINTFGLIAQEVYDVIPEVVNKPDNDSENLWSLDYDRFTPVIIKSVQELKQEKDNEVGQLKERIETLTRIICLDHPENDICK
ncbi:MAG: tail fiber domain-containing protein, partial [bacterium]